MKPSELNICGIHYKIEYTDNPAEVDHPDKRQLLNGQIDYWTRKIRVLEKERPIEDIWFTIIHEVLHGIGESFKLTILDKGLGGNNHDELDLLSLALTDFLFRNNLIKVNNDGDT